MILSSTGLVQSITKETDPFFLPLAAAAAVATPRAISPSLPPLPALGLVVVVCGGAQAARVFQGER
jgi:hypothetical protein